MSLKIKPYKTAIHDQIISTSRDVFDYGCAKVDDIAFLKSRGILCYGWVRHVDL